MVNIAGMVNGESQKQHCNIFDGAALRNAEQITADTHDSLSCSHLAVNGGSQGPAGTISLLSREQVFIY